MSFSEQAARRTEALGPAIRGMLWMTLCGLCFAGLNATTRDGIRRESASGASIAGTGIGKKQGAV